MPSITNAKTPLPWLNNGFLANLGISSYIIPIAGSKKIYTSGWNVNQNKCKYAIGSPPAVGLKKPDTPSLSVSNMINAAAYDGIATSVIKDTVSIDHAKSGTLRNGKSGCLHLRIVTTKLIEDNIDDIPKILRPNIIM